MLTQKQTSPSFSKRCGLSTAHSQSFLGLQISLIGPVEIWKIKSGLPLLIKLTRSDLNRVKLSHWLVDYIRKKKKTKTKTNLVAVHFTLHKGHKTRGKSTSNFSLKYIYICIYLDLNMYIYIYVCIRAISTYSLKKKN